MNLYKGFNTRRDNLVHKFLLILEDICVVESVKNSGGILFASESTTRTCINYCT